MPEKPHEDLIWESCRFTIVSSCKYITWFSLCISSRPSKVRSRFSSVRALHVQKAARMCSGRGLKKTKKEGLSCSGALKLTLNEAEILLERELLSRVLFILSEVKKNHGRAIQLYASINNHN